MKWLLGRSKCVRPRSVTIVRAAGAKVSPPGGGPSGRVRKRR
jgi:hypothetical protein